MLRRRLVSRPAAVVTLGIAWFFVSMLMLWLTDLFIGTWGISGFWNDVWATIAVRGVNLVVDLPLRDRDASDG